jgi:hypothetical protein
MSFADGAHLIDWNAASEAVRTGPTGAGNISGEAIMLARQELLKSRWPGLAQATILANRHLTMTRNMAFYAKSLT